MVFCHWKRESRRKMICFAQPRCVFSLWQLTLAMYTGNKNNNLNMYLALRTRWGGSGCDSFGLCVSVCLCVGGGWVGGWWWQTLTYAKMTTVRVHGAPFLSPFGGWERGGKKKKGTCACVSRWLSLVLRFLLELRVCVIPGFNEFEEYTKEKKKEKTPTTVQNHNNPTVNRTTTTPQKKKNKQTRYTLIITGDCNSITSACCYTPCQLFMQKCLGTPKRKISRL